jgi:uncharacterized protein (TIGR02285 family)
VRFHFLALLVDLLVCLVAHSAQAAEPLVWAVLDFPPFQILDGESRGTGSFDGLLGLLTTEMPDYRHEVVGMTFARREEEIRQGSQLCTPGMFRTPAREKLLLFSRPALLHLDNRLVVRRETLARLPAPRPVLLDQVLADQSLLGGIIADRSFAPNIDETLRRHAGAPNLLVRTMKSAQLFEMLSRGDIDYTILFPHEVAYLARAAGHRDDIVVLPIAGTPPHIMTHVACTKGPWGAATIAAVDAVIGSHLGAPAYRALSERWYDEPDKALIRRYYNRALSAPDPR